MDKEVVLNKLESLRRSVSRVEIKTPVSVVELIDDIDLQDIIVLNLERAVQVCVDTGVHLISGLDEITMPSSMSDTFKALANGGIIDKDLAHRLSKSVGFRNTAVHAYRDIDWEIVYSIITTRLVDFRDFARCIIHYLDKNGST